MQYIAGRYDPPVVLSAPSKMPHLCSRLVDRGQKLNKCTVNARRKYVESEGRGRGWCRTPLICVRGSTGQTGRCINDRAREHALLVRITVGGYLYLCCVTCIWITNVDSIMVMAKVVDNAAKGTPGIFGDRKGMRTKRQSNL